VEFPAEVYSTMEWALESAVCLRWAEVHLYRYVSNVSEDCSGCHWGKEGILARGFDEA